MRRVVALLTIAVALTGVAFISAPYAHGFSFVVRAADMQGSLRRIADVAALLTERDRSDATRAASPLYAAPDAEIVDTTGKPVEQVVREVLALVRRKI